MKKNYGKALRKEKKGFLEAKLLFFSLEVIFPQGKNPQAGKRILPERLLPQKLQCTCTCTRNFETQREGKDPANKLSERSKNSIHGGLVHGKSYYPISLFAIVSC